MIINTKDYNGNDIRIRYSAEKIEQVAAKPELVIESYQAFKMCAIKATEQSEYQPKYRDLRYQSALGELSRKDPEQYRKYTDMMRQERWSQRNGK